ncbi:MAG: hypothetical protein NXY59_05430 [Aigarchaeota archaeon]|nr:hypothetical protein [Candidatus Pelearchaeum maunauluense]
MTWDVVVAVREEAREEFFDRLFKKLWILTEVNLTSTKLCSPLKSKTNKVIKQLGLAVVGKELGKQYVTNCCM